MIVQALSNDGVSARVHRVVETRDFTVGISSSGLCRRFGLDSASGRHGTGRCRRVARRDGVTGNDASASASGHACAG